MLKRKLSALGYHHPDAFNINNEIEVRNFVVWLEDKKIRLYKIEERDALRDVESSCWVEALKKYLADLNCPVENISNKLSVMNWLISHAVQVEYEENVTMYKCYRDIQKRTVRNKHFFESLNSDDSELKAGVESLRQLFQIPECKNTLVVLQAITKLIQMRLTAEAIDRHVKERPEKNIAYLSLENSTLGFDTKDPSVNDAAKIIRLLQIHNLRKLQTRINQAIVAVQKLSANPKTDQSLGKVGR
ncbi:RNA transcription, translation and transport factor protein-like [Hydractinia symbiolongicarpus]|uniref:RNA transcription, translation and transport factor protein-like n=1 Tax=Hydractinia symbiolongicarpus TaxID=13093 RepID=UPI00254C6A7A|nr:RNA transcription, translation and transport factor protein-like [Hydractinia symbiolongicarpus]